jgi:hypothetical protein
MQLQRLLFEPTLVRSPLRVVQWWESRRPAYNLIVGATGLGTLVYINALELALGQGWFAVPWGGPGSAAQMLAIGVYGLAANVCYTGGWVTVLPAMLITAVNILGRLFAP